MLREEVASHYRAKGYTISERARVRGTSGAVHTVDMVAQGPLGNLVIAIEDAGGFEGPEMHAVRRAARDIGATPVMAARRIPEGLRRQASEAGVVLLDDTVLAAAPPPEPASDNAAIEYPPWPGQEGRAVERPAVIDDFAPRRSKSTDPGFWRYPRDGETVEQAEAEAPAVTLADLPDIEEPLAPAGQFEWLANDQVAVAPLRRATVSVPQQGVGLGRWIIGAASFGAAAGAMLYFLSRIFG